MSQIIPIGSRILICACFMSAFAAFARGQSDFPEIFAIEPNTGITTPGIKVKVYGRSFPADTFVYFGGLQVRALRFLDASTVEVVTPYLRPGRYQLQLRTGDIVKRSDVTFTASPSPIDSEIDNAIKLAHDGNSVAAIATLTSIAKTNPDYQVRAFAYYQIGQIYFELGDWWHWAGVPIFMDSDKSGAAVQTSWKYRLSEDESTYLLPVEGTDMDAPLKLADWTVKYDVTQNPEPRFFRALVNARCGKLEKAIGDVDFILRTEPDNFSYRALAAYIAVLGGDNRQIKAFSTETIKDARALNLLGEAAYLAGDFSDAQQWWHQAAKIYPLGGSLAYWTGKKHLVRGEQRVAAALLAECVAIAPDTKEGKGAQQLLTNQVRSSP